MSISGRRFEILLPLRFNDGSPVHDLHATLLHLLGIDHKRLTVKFQGLDMRLTNVAGNVVTDLFA